MSNQVAARLKGDAYQASFFWLQAAKLLFDPSFETVSLERNDITGVDDVCVAYGGYGAHDPRGAIFDDYYQIKYHVDQSSAYSSALLLARKTEKSSSLLDRFYKAYLERKKSGRRFRLTLVSNWRWEGDDSFVRAFRTDPGTLPNAFFEEKPLRVHREIRKDWANHLGISEAELLDFATHLRFMLDFHSLDRLEELVNAALSRAKLKTMDIAQDSNPYVGMAISYIMDGRQEFTKEMILESCTKAGLVALEAGLPIQIGVRSRMLGAENMQSETSRMLCLCDHFEERFIREPTLWASEVYPQLKSFLQPRDLRELDHHLLLDCHLSIAYTCGLLLEPALGAKVYPFQKGNPPTIWRPESEKERADLPSLDHEVVDWSEDGEDLVVSVSLTHPIRTDVETYLSAKAVPVKTMLAVSLGDKPSWQSVKGAPHAIWLAGELQQLIRSTKQKHKTQTTHLFVSGPNGFMYYLGQAGKFLNPMQLYEHDPEGLRGGGYLPSLRLPVVPQHSEPLNTSKELV